MAYGQEPSGSSYGSQQGTTGGTGGQVSSGTGGQGTGGGNYDWNSFAQQIPEQYRSDPSQFIQAFQESQKYRDWYHQQYEPWHKNFDAKDYEEYRKSRQQQSEDIDWEDYSAPRKAYEQLSSKYKSLEQTLEERSQQVVQLMQLLQQAGDLRWSEVHDHLGKSGFKPQMDPRAVIEFAMKHGVQDLNLAAQHLRQQASQARATEPARQFRSRQAPQSERDFRAMIREKYPHSF